MGEVPPAEGSSSPLAEAVKTMAYYVLQVRTGKEKNVLARLEKEHPEIRSRLSWPRRTMLIRRRGKTRKEEKPIYPGYLFLDGPPPEQPDSPGISPEILHIFRKTPDVARFLPDSQNPRPLPEEEERILRRLTRTGDITALSKVSFDENQRIVVKEGPLQGLEGQIVKVDRRKKRARIRLDLYKEGHLVDFSFEVIKSP